MPTIPPDIERKINALFPATADNKEVKALISDLWTMDLNVGAAQLARSILVLSAGDLQKLKTIFTQDFYGDPRDVIMMAENLYGNPGHYFITAFEDVE